ncbi:hypothetical protein KJ612_00400 [Myxococcota bacterium]|nr:hypothetical protein [Myxococcota bacterium]
MCKHILLISLLLPSLLAGCKSGSSDSKAPAGPPAPPPPAQLAATAGWKLDMEQFSLVSSVGADWAHVVSFSGNHTQYRPVDQLMVATSDGTVRWKKRRTMKVYGENVPWSLRTAALNTKTLFYETRYKSIYHMAVADGASDRSLGNVFHFAPCGQNLFVGAAEPYLWNPAEKKNIDIAGLKPLFEEIDVLVSPNFPATALGPDRVAFRTQDGALRTVSCSQQKELWQYADPLDRKDWSVDLPLSGNTVLVSTLMPPFLPRAVVQGIREGEPVALPGTLQAQMPVSLTGSIATFLSTEGLNMVTLSGVDTTTGETAWHVELPIVPCTRTETFHVCRNGKNVFAIDLATGKKTLDQDMAVTPRFITAQGDFVAAATTDDKFAVMNMRENTVVWTGPITIKTAPVELVQFALARPDRFALVLRTLWPDRPHLERLYLHSFSPAEPEKALQVQLGKPQESRVPARIGTGERELNLPVWVHGGELYSAVDGLFQTLDIARGTSTNSFTLPGKGPVSLLKVRTDGSALLERADQLVLVKARSGIAWTAPLKDREIRQVTSETVVLAEAYALSALSLTDGKPVGPGAKDLKSMPSVRAATASRIYFNMPDGNYLLENNEVKKVKEYPMLSVHPADRDWLVFTKNESPPGKGSWAAVDADSGKVLWQKLVTRTPEVVGGAKDISEIEPREASFHPASWVRASAEGFWIPDPSHRCLYLIRPTDGQVTWVRCAQRLGGPPVFTADGQWMLLPAAGPWHEVGQPIPDGTVVEKNLSLVALHLRDRHSLRLYTPPENFSVAMPVASPEGSQLIVTVYEEKFKNQKCFLQSFTLGVPKESPRTDR